jgi:hypothetical protein
MNSEQTDQTQQPDAAPAPAPAAQPAPDAHLEAPSQPPAAPAQPPAAPAQPPAQAGPRRPQWLDEVSALAQALHRWLLRPRVRLSVIGGALLLIGALIVANSVWTLPLVVVGVLMVAVAWIGHRLEGRFTVEWGHSGTELALRATLKPAHDVHRPAAQPALEAKRHGDDTPDFIEGEAHTVEIDVAELKALIAAAHPAEDEPPDIRIRRAAATARSVDGQL